MKKSRPQRIFRTFAATLALALGLPLTMIAGTTPALAAATGRVIADPCLNLRTAADSSASVLACIPYNTTITITCTTNGSSMSGPYGVTQLWNKTTWNGKTGYVTDAFVYTGTNGAVAGSCSSAPTVTRGQTISYNPYAAQYSGSS